MVNDGGIVTCVDAVKRRGGLARTRSTDSYSASPIAADGRIYFFSEDGKATVIAAGREFKVLAENSLDAGFMASPAVDGRALYLRTKTHLYRIRKRATGSALRHPPDRVRPVVADEQRAVRGDRDADRTAPDVALVGDEAGQEILVLADRLAVASSARGSPCSRCAGCGSTSRAPRRRRAALVERRSRRSSDALCGCTQHVGHDHLVLQLRMLARVTRILVCRRCRTTASRRSRRPPRA